MAINPYAAPTAQVADGAAFAGESQFLDGGQPVSAGRGWTWITEAWGLFREQPVVWLLQFIAAAVLFVVISIIPIVGQIVPSLLGPVFAAGIMLGAHQLAGGEPLSFGKLFAGFSHRFGSLALTGLFILVAGLAALMIGAGIGGVGVGVFFGTPDAAPMSFMGIILAVLIVLALSIPIYMAVWFAPALIMLNEFTVTQALTTSFSASLKNIVPFLVYGVLIFIILMIASIPFGLGLIIALPVMMLAAYTSYRDVFYLS